MCFSIDCKKKQTIKPLILLYQFFVICTKNCTDNIKTSKSENYSFSIYNKKSGKKIDFQFWFFIRTKKTELHYPIIEPL